jgi:alanyl-tRNA synthetase
VLEVTIREEDDEVLHWLPVAIAGDRVAAEIDWERRFDHMQQHSGQHILSQAFVVVAEAETVGFHLSADTVTIDLDKKDLTQAQLEQAEVLANRIIWQNRPVTARMVTTEEASQLPLRKVPPAREGALRLIEIEHFDLTACGGTHISHAGEIGMIKIVRTERRGGQLRVEFRCGQRALEDYRAKNGIVNALAASFTTGQPEILQAVERLREENKESRRMVKALQNDLVRKEAESLIRNGRRNGNVTVVSHVMKAGDPSQLRALGLQLAATPGVVALLGLAGSKSLLLFARSDDAPGEMNQLLKAGLAVLGSNAGGGSTTVAQGGGPAADDEQVARAIVEAERLLLELA